MEGAGQLVSTLGQLVGDEYRQLSGVGRQVAELRDELATMNSILRLQSEADDGTVDHFVREWMKQVREVAHDAEDCVDIYIFRIQCGRLRDLGFLVWSKRLLATLSTRRRLAGEIEALHGRAVAIAERHVRYSVSREALMSRHASAASTPRLDLVPVVSAVKRSRPHHQFIGGGQADILARQVTAMTRELKVFSILGVGGIGKTTLATEVCRRLETEFDIQAHLSVSRTFSASKDLKALLTRLLHKILEEENPIVDQLYQMSVEDLARTLKEILQDKRYLIVIDGLWTISAWAAIRSRLPENNCGSRVLVTTETETVAKACSHDFYNIQPLSMNHSQILFVRRVSGCPDASWPKHLQLEDEIVEILRKCDGLPMAIVSIAGILKGYESLRSQDMEVRVRRSIESHMENTPTQEGMRQILTLSYNLLPYYLKGCMIYLSIFPRNYIIGKVRLLWGWIAEGLVEEKMGFTLFEIAEQYFEELVSRSMIVLADGIMTNGNREAIWIGDMMFDLIVSKSREANFVSLVGGQYAGMPYHRVRRLSIHDGGQGSFSKKNTPGRGNYGSGIEGMNLKYVRSLSMFSLERHKVLDRLGEFTLVRVLDLEECKRLENMHMRAICRMYLLRYLGLKGTNISVVPPEVGDLEHLQTLDVYQTRLSELPTTVTKLKKVERLLFSSKLKDMWKPPSGLSEMKALREVRNVVIDNVQAAEEIADLEQLQAIDVFLDTTSHSQHKEEEVCIALAHSLCKTYTLHSLNVGSHSLDNFINLLEPPPLLRYLGISGIITRFPDWVGSLTYLDEFSISRTKLADDQLFDILCKAPNLQSVLFGNSFYATHQLVARTAHNFPALKVMRVPSCDEWPRVFQFEEGSMTRLETLEVNFGGNTKKRIVGIDNLTRLKKVQLSGERGNPALDRAFELIKAESDPRPKDSQFKVVVKYS